MFREKVNIESELGKTVDFWNQEFSKGLIYGINPSEAAVKTVDFLKRKVVTGSEHTLLEIGGGYGRNAKYFIEQLGISTTLFDISAKAIDLAKSVTFPCLPNNLNFIQGDVNSLNLMINPESYDIVFHNFCLHLLCFSNRSKIYSNVAKVLKPGGIFIGSYLSVNDPDCPDSSFNQELTTLVRGKEQHFFKEEEIKNELIPYFNIEEIIEGNDLELIISEMRKTVYYYVVGVKK